MIKLKLLSIAFLLIAFHSISYTQEKKCTSEEVEFLNDTILLKAKFCNPVGVDKPPIILIIAGSGPTDMDGNNFMMKNNHLKFLAESLAKEGIATLRYNKRIIPDNGNKIKEKNLVFEDLVDDAVYLLNELKKNKNHQHVYVLGHSQGERDIQVTREDALMLEEASPKADLYYISEMNHILKNAPEERQKNLETYSDPDLPVNEKLIEIISQHIK